MLTLSSCVHLYLFLSPHGHYRATNSLQAHRREWDFLPALSEWMLGKVEMERNNLAYEVIRSANDVFLGIGVYTVIFSLRVRHLCTICFKEMSRDLLFVLGLSPFLTESELFHNPYRTKTIVEVGRRTVQKEMSPFEDVCAQLAAQVLDFFIQIDSGGDA